jgi:phosphoribosylformylglycinamidine (FGAM) synthase-like amidotransferase family enzyme
VREFLALPLALLVAAPSEPVATGPGTAHFDGMPPERFWQEDVAIVVFVNDVTELCGDSPPGLTMIACTRKIEGQVVVVMPHPVGHALAGEYYARILTHELGHHAGWTGMHEE